MYNALIKRISTGSQNDDKSLEIYITCTKQFEIEKCLMMSLITRKLDFKYMLLTSTANISQGKIYSRV